MGTLLCMLGIHAFDWPMKWTALGATYSQRVCVRPGCRVSRVKRLG